MLRDYDPAFIEEVIKTEYAEDEAGGIAALDNEREYVGHHGELFRRHTEPGLPHSPGILFQQWICWHCAAHADHDHQRLPEKQEPTV